MTKEQAEYLQQWMFKANEDIAVINNLAKEDITAFTGAVCFHSQQAIEKFLKAYLVFKSFDFRKTHDLDYLLTECRKIDPRPFIDLELKNLSEYGVCVRYPDDFIIPAVADTIYFIDLPMRVKETVEIEISTSS